MTGDSEHAPSGWYNDPHAPDRMRYFDGRAWTNHFHEPGRLPEIGKWLSTTFSVIGNYWAGASAIAFGTTLVGNVVLWASARSILSDIAFVDEDLVNFTFTKGLAIAALIVFVLVWQGFGWLALNRYIQRAHFQAEPKVGEAFAHSLTRLPTYLRVTVGLLLAFMLVILIISALTVAVPVLGAFAILAAVVASVWFYVKLSFLPSAITAAPLGSPVLHTSAEVSTGRFWPVLGRLLLVSLGLGVVGLFASPLVGSPVDAEQFSVLFEIDDDQFRVADDFEFRTLFSSTGRLVIVILLTSVLRAATAAISSSAVMRLYLDSEAPSEI